MDIYRPFALLSRGAENTEFLLIVFSPERWENTIHQALQAKSICIFLTGYSFIRIPLSGILIKFLSLRSLGLCGEIVFGQE